MTIHRSQRNWGCRIHEITWYGIDAVVLENDRVRLTFLTGKGSDLVEFNQKARDLDFAWLAPGGIRNPRDLVTPNRDARGAFIESYPGGWQEVFPSAGAPAVWAGASYGQHGEVFGLPWDFEIVEDGQDRVSVAFSVRGVKTPCTIRKVVSLEPGRPGFAIEETVTNHAPVPFAAMWGHHVTFGPPFLEPGCRIELPEGIVAIPHESEVGETGRRVADAESFTWPEGWDATGVMKNFSVLPDKDTASDLFYLHGFGDTGSYRIVRPRDGSGMQVRWDARTMPYLWYWQEFGGTTGWPWYGRNYNIGLEPGSSYPTNGLPDAVANGSAMQLEPGETRTFWLTADLFEKDE